MVLRAACACSLLVTAAWPSATWAQAGPARTSPKVAVVVSGDPDASVREPAARLDGLLGGHPDVTLPADPGLRRALRGEAASEDDDGLEGARTERRRLGWGEDRDVEVLARIGRMAGAHLLLVVRQGEDGVEAVAFDVRASAFYEGALPLPGGDRDDIARFVMPRAQAAAEKRATPPEPARAAEAPTGASGTSTTPLPEAPAAAASTAESSRASATGGDPQDEASSDKPWIGRNWPYLVAGALLAASIVFMVVRSGNDDPGPPVLRFSLGSDP
jgi:hypothetical protein